MADVPAPRPLRLRKLDEGWWRACRGGQVYDLYRDEGLGQFRAIVRDKRDVVIAEKTFDLTKRGAWTEARQFLEADGQVPGVRRRSAA